MKVNTELLESRLASAKRIVLVGHLNPDGDCVGSVTAMYHYLMGRGKKANIVLPGDVPHNIRFLLPKDPQSVTIFSQEDDSAANLIKSADLIICEDLNQLSRTEGLAPSIAASQAPRILIDHHPEVAGECFDLKYTSTEVSSACELLYDIFISMPDIGGEIGKLSLDCATSLYTGMITDTNNFSNSIFPETLTMASALLARGVDRTRIQEEVLQAYPEGRLRLLGHLLKDKMVVMEKEKAAYMVLSMDEKEMYGIKAGDTEGFVNFPLSMGNVTISALFSEDDSRKFIRVSLRSKGTTDVNTLARRSFNGGGHRNAAGGRLFIPLEDVGEYFEKALKEYLFEKQ